jgi:hypothetical protein
VTQPLDIITRSLRRIGAAAAGQAPGTNDVNNAFDVLNEMLDQWSNDHLLVFVQQEVIFECLGSVFTYTVGPSTAGGVGTTNVGTCGAAITGSIAGNVLTVTSLASGALSVGQILNTQAGITVGTAITSLSTGIGGNGTGALGTYTLNLPNTFGPGAITSYVPRPLRVNRGIVRVINSATGTLDKKVAMLTYEQYLSIGIKTLPGPWPRAVYYQPTMPNGIFFCWSNPAQGEMHLYCDTVLNQFATINDTVNLPQGYIGALSWSLAELLLTEYGETNESIIRLVTMNAANGRRFIARTNMHPQTPARIDSALASSSTQDAGWILDGGFS